jgi:uncharacterized protein (DUF2267 family)
MHDQEFMDHVQAGADLPSQDEAERATEVVLSLSGP